MDIAKFAHLLARLAYEDEFRQRFIENPEKTLSDMGIDPAKAYLPESPIELPSKDKLQQEYEDRFKRLVVEADFPLHALI